nr:EAL domain-containing protein [Lachnospiraceae bacterium]
FGIFGILVFYFALYYRPLRVLDRLLANIASDMPQALFFFDAFGKCIWANDHGIKLVNIEEERFDTASASLEEMFGNLDRDMDEWAEQYVLGEEDHEKYYAVEKHTVKDEKNRITGSFLSVRDNTEEQKRFLQEIYNATHDQLTGLYTKEHLYAKIKDKILSDRDTVFYIIFVDVKNFKIVNDIFGNRFGDYAIKCIAEWIRNTVSEGSVYGRIAGDTFGMCIPKEEFNAMKAKADLSNFIVKEGQKVHHVLIHLGIYEITKEDVDVSVMFDRAHLAIAAIKDDYHEHLVYYDNRMREKALWDQSISVQLPDAIKEKQLRPYLQPIVDKNGNVVGAEALIRWIHPENGFMSPGVFIPVFEKNGLIVEADKYMWRSACEILSRWEKEGRNMFISVNISPKDFYFTNVTETLKKYVKEYGIDPKNLRIEITESVMMSDIDNRMENLRELKNEGFIVEMDDFGSGFSSLNLLKDMPVDVLKIDMMFLSKSNDNQKALTIMQNIINLSDNLSMASLTEGVETADQFDTLNGLGCKLFQGYYFAKPMPVEEFEEKYPVK